jgi:hypothetical protein
MDENPGKLVGHGLAAGLIVLAAIASLYLGTYCWALDDGYHGYNDDVIAGRELRYSLRDEYRIGGDVARAAFWPANQLDRFLRRERWPVYRLGGN